MDKSTMTKELRPLMLGCSVILNHCAVCGKSYPLNQHHIVKRSAGELYKQGIKLQKPTITLCGQGNTNGCHRLAHQNRLHFRWVNDALSNGKPSFGQTAYGSGHWEYLMCQEPTKYHKALEMNGWQKLPNFRRTNE